MGVNPPLATQNTTATIPLSTLRPLQYVCVCLCMRTTYIHQFLFIFSLLFNLLCSECSTWSTATIFQQLYSLFLFSLRFVIWKLIVSSLKKSLFNLSFYLLLVYYLGRFKGSDHCQIATNCLWNFCLHPNTVAVNTVLFVMLKLEKLKLKRVTLTLIECFQTFLHLWSLKTKCVYLSQVAYVKAWWIYIFPS